jgi:vacuolar-type H+-ATPase subunit I/STV1
MLFTYQLLTGLSDTSTGFLLIFFPYLTLSLMKVHVVPNTALFLSYIGVFILSVGLACLYGAALTPPPALLQKLEVVWLLTAITRGLVAAFIVWKILSGLLEPGWAAVAISDGAFALLQGIGLWRGWLTDAAG